MLIVPRRRAAVTYDTDAQTYITAVEAADGQSLETATRDAINAFVVGCKADGIWSAIKASCILAGARTLAGALVPLVGTAPTNNGPFASTDYNRKTGLLGNGTTKSLNSGRKVNADPQNNQHLSVFVSQQSTTQGYPIYIGGDLTHIVQYNSENQIAIRQRNITANIISSSATATGLIGASRASSTDYTARYNGASSSITQVSANPGNVANTFVFANNSSNEATTSISNARISFYSIGESLDLGLLDTRVSALISAIAAAF